MKISRHKAFILRINRRIYNCKMRNVADLCPQICTCLQSNDSLEARVLLTTFSNDVSVYNRKKTKWNSLISSNSNLRMLLTSGHKLEEKIILNRKWFTRPSVMQKLTERYVCISRETVMLLSEPLYCISRPNACHRYGLLRMHCSSVFLVVTKLTSEFWAFVQNASVSEHSHKVEIYLSGTS